MAALAENMLGFNMWSHALQNHMTLLDLTQYGWMVVEEKLECDWESAENQTAMRDG